MTLAWSITALAEEDTSRFVSGTKINGVTVSNLTVAEAKAQIETYFSTEYQLTIEERDQKTETISGPAIGYQVTVSDGLDQILQSQNEAGRPSGPAIDNSNTLAMEVQYSQEALKGRIQELECVSGDQVIQTCDAAVSPYVQGQPFVIIPEVQGNSVNLEKLTAVLEAAVNSGNTTVNLEEAGCYDTVTVTAENEQLKALCDTMNQCREMTITYQFGSQSQVLTGETIRTWLQGTADGQIDVNYDQAAAYVKSLADQYDTVGKARTFSTVSGKEVTLTGPYGWQMDQAGETAALISMIRTGQSQVREPLYAKSGASRDNDWGNTYVEIDLTGQHVYMIKNGAVVWDAPCVTGNVSKNYTTPEGIYSLTYKETDRILRGAKKADGTYEYESHVDYWMPFNGGIGLHDANWRGSFGGQIYKTNGSHGCINLPPSKTKALYDLVYKGIPVICYN